MIKRILVALSGTPYTPAAVEYAIELAQLHKAELSAVTIIDVEKVGATGPVPIGAGAAAHRLSEHRIQQTEHKVQEEVGAFESACSAAGVRSCVYRQHGDVLEQISDCWRYHDLTVFGLRGMFEYGVLENPDDWVVTLLAAGVRPILAVPQAHRPTKRVLIAYNGSNESAKAMKAFVQTRLWPDVKIRVVCFDKNPDHAASLLADAKSYCHAHGYDAEIDQVAASPREGLLPHARGWSADLVVMGGTSRSKLAKLIMGDTILHAMQHADVPLLLSH